MKILLINPPVKEQPVARDMAGGLGFDGGQAVILPPMDLAYMAATLIARGDDVKIIDSAVLGYGAEDIFDITKSYNPDAVVLNISLPSLDADCSFARQMRNNSSCRIIAKTGIPYPPILKEILRKSLAEFCIYGEADLAIGEMLDGKVRTGTAYFENGKLVVEDNIFIKDLNKLPLPARKLLHNDKYRYALLGEGVATMQTTRGCPFPCGYYCAYPLVQGKIWRPRSPEHVLNEIEDIVKNCGINKILFRDATFTLDKERTRRICELIISRALNISWWCETRVDCLDEELMGLMKRSGCMGINLGVETGDQAIMEAEAKMGLTMDKLKSVREFAKSIGIKLHFLLMIGLPGETKKSIYKTHRMIRELGPESIGACIVTPYPGTQLYADAKEKGWLETEDWSKYGGHYPVAHTDKLSTADMLRAHQYLLKIFLLRREGSFRARFMAMIMEACFKAWASISA